jgi:hypothetical protein
MMWMLFVILLETDRYMISPNGLFTSEAECLTAREYFISTAPQPQINYEAVCIATDKVGL